MLLQIALLRHVKKSSLSVSDANCSMMQNAYIFSLSPIRFVISANAFWQSTTRASPAHRMIVIKGKGKPPIVNSTLSQLCDPRARCASLFAGLEPAVSCKHSSVIRAVGTPLPYTAITSPAVSPVPNYTAWWQRHMCVNNLPRVVTWQWNGRESNLMLMHAVDLIKWCRNKEQLSKLLNCSITDQLQCTLPTQ